MDICFGRFEEPLNDLRAATSRVKAIFKQTDCFKTGKPQIKHDSFFQKSKKNVIINMGYFTQARGKTPVSEDFVNWQRLLLQVKNGLALVQHSSVP